MRDNEKMKMSFGARVLYAIMCLFSLLPLRVHYWLSDVLYLLVYCLIGYRVGVVRKNLRESFPDKSEKELRSVERKYYHWFCDYIVETIKFATIGEKELRRRMQFVGTDAIDQCFAEGTPCSIYLGHYCNWEWIVSLPLHVHGGFCSQIYHPIENKALDQVLYKVRNRFGSRNIEMDQSFRTIVSWKKSGQMHLVGYIADQVPGLHNVHCWVDFLHHDTPVFTGAERISVLTDAAVFYADIRRPRRGCYVCTMKRIMPPEGGYVKFHYTREYYRLLEQSINNAPQYWLWSHNRWKRTREDFNREYSEEERNRMLNRL